MAAATGGRYDDIVEVLVNNKADINIQDKNQVSTCEFSKMMQPTTILSCSDITDASCTHWVHITNSYIVVSMHCCNNESI